MISNRGKKMPSQTPSQNIDTLTDKILLNIKQNELPCARAFQIADELKIPPLEVGRKADELKIRLSKCQLGLFGYQPQKKVVKALEKIDVKIDSAIRKNLENNNLACSKAWEIAGLLNIPRMRISNTCEALEIRIKDCQLGAFD
jgi:hypothetical protein